MGASSSTDTDAPRPPRGTAAGLVLAILIGMPALLELPATGWTGHHGTPRPVAITPLVVDVNLASPGLLAALPGVGPVLAERIATERERMPFGDADDLGRTHGIGPATIARLRPHLRFGPTRALSPRR
jgi:competence protein ComEA